MNPYIQYMYSYPHKTAYGPLKGIILKDYAPMLAGSGHGLYLAIYFQLPGRKAEPSTGIWMRWKLRADSMRSFWLPMKQCSLT